VKDPQQGVDDHQQQHEIRRDLHIVLGNTCSQCQVRVPRRRVSISAGSSFCSCASSTTSASRCISSSVGGIVHTSHANWASTRVRRHHQPTALHVSLLRPQLRGIHMADRAWDAADGTSSDDHRRTPDIGRRVNWRAGAIGHREARPASSVSRSDPQPRAGGSHQPRHRRSTTRPGRRCPLDLPS
jgi:hypothetical protein